MNSPYLISTNVRGPGLDQNTGAAKNLGFEQQQNQQNSSSILGQQNGSNFNLGGVMTSLFNANNQGDTNANQ